jgi:glyoxylase-like metal-dependent hydrolase (beta-lactamase superfamily II)
MKKTDGKIFTSADGSIIIDDDFLVVVDAGCEQRTVRDFLSLSKKTGKPIAYIFLSHFHWDHVYNVKAFKKSFPELVTIGHKNNYAAEMKILEKQTLQLGTLEYDVIPAPGHSPRMDDICVFLKESGVLFVGDLCQPQGRSFRSVDFVTPVPYFSNGEKYIASL